MKKNRTRLILDFVIKQPIKSAILLRLQRKEMAIRIQERSNSVTLIIQVISTKIGQYISFEPSFIKKPIIICTNCFIHFIINLFTFFFSRESILRKNSTVVQQPTKYLTLAHELFVF